MAGSCCCSWCWEPLGCEEEAGKAAVPEDGSQRDGMALRVAAGRWERRTPGWECCKSSLWRGKVVPAVGCGQGMWSVLDTGATAPPDKCSPSPAILGCVVLPGGCFSCREFNYGGVFVPGKGKGWECWCRANQSPQSLPHPCFPSSWEELSIWARACRDVVPGIRFPLGLAEGLFD